MLVRNRSLLYRLILSELKKGFWFKWSIILRGALILLLLIGIYHIHMYYNRLDLIDSFVYDNDIYELYRDWSKSTHYFRKPTERSFDDNYYVIKKNGNVYFRYQHNYSFVYVYDAFFFCFVELDSLVLVQREHEGYGAVFLKMPLNKEVITKKDVRIIPIFPGILKDGSKLRDDDSTHYLLDDYKKVPLEVINYEDIISDY